MPIPQDVAGTLLVKEVFVYKLLFELVAPERHSVGVGLEGEEVKAHCLVFASR